MMRLARAQGLDTALDALESINHGDLARNDPAKPTLHPWRLDSAEDERRILTRNPYYARVDSAGNQLPYIDRIVARVVPDHKTYTLKVLTGEADIAYSHTNFADLMLLKKTADSGAYDITLMSGARIVLLLNLEHPDRADLYRDVRFRRALSLSINREKIAELGYYSLPLYPDVYTAYDPDEADVLLNEAGLEKDLSGDRRFPGDRSSATLVCYKYFGVYDAVLQAIKSDWEEVGISVSCERYPPENQELHDVVAMVVIDGYTDWWGGVSDKPNMENPSVIEVVGLAHPFVAANQIQNVPGSFVLGMPLPGALSQLGEQLFFRQ